MEQDKIWDKIQTDPDLVDYGCNDSGRLDYISKKIKNGSVLNIGVGSGKLEKILLQQLRGVFSLDPSKNTIDAVNLLGVKGRVGRIENIPFEECSFEYVVVSEVFEHLDTKTISDGLQEIYRILKPGGTLIATVPADEKLKNAFCICPCCGENFHRWGHVQSFNKSRLLNLFGQVFDHTSVKRIHFYDFRKLNFLGKIMSLIKALRAHADYVGSNQNFYITAKK